MFLDNCRQFSGTFGQSGIPRQTYFIDKYLKRKLMFSFDLYKIPKSDTENLFIENPVNKQQFMEDQGQLKKVLDLI